MTEIIIRTCQYIGPDQDPRTAHIHYCGKPVVEGKSYCHEHYGIVYQFGTSLSGRRKRKEIERELKYIQEKEASGLVD